MGRSAGSAALAGVLATFLFVSVATSGDVQYAERSPSFSLESWWSELVGTEGQDLGVDLPEEQTDPFLVWEVDLPDALATVLKVLLVAGAVAVVIELWRRRPRLRWRRNRVRIDVEAIDDLVDVVAADAAAQRAVLATGSPRNAIVACWLRLEAATAAAGFEPDPAETAQEATTRILSQFAVDGVAVSRLASLYREARFSTHEMGEAQRLAAVEALDSIHSGLRAETEALVPHA